MLCLAVIGCVFSQNISNYKCFFLIKWGQRWTLMRTVEIIASVASLVGNMIQMITCCLHSSQRVEDKWYLIPNNTDWLLLTCYHIQSHTSRHPENSTNIPAKICTMGTVHHTCTQVKQSVHSLASGCSRQFSCAISEQSTGELVLCVLNSKMLNGYRRGMNITIRCLFY